MIMGLKDVSALRRSIASTTNRWQPSLRPLTPSHGLHCCKPSVAALRCRPAGALRFYVMPSSERLNNLNYDKIPESAPPGDGSAGREGVQRGAAVTLVRPRPLPAHLR